MEHSHEETKSQEKDACQGTRALCTLQNMFNVPWLPRCSLSRQATHKECWFIDKSAKMSAPEERMGWLVRYSAKDSSFADDRAKYTGQKASSDHATVVR
mmetsp:Transcript_3828/g.13631  ORF Transcript_3828/g.13631 Transcript_3828/m.13631 type:complete len:99 (+) Transcript_3828:1365-1661(+)